MIVKLKKNALYRDLTFGQPYVVIGIEADELRILNDAGRPFPYRPNLFSMVDPQEPVDWVTEFGDDGERYSYPPPLNKSGFFEDFFDQNAKAVAMFWRAVNQRLAGSQRKVLAHDEVLLADERLRESLRQSDNLITTHGLQSVESPNEKTR